MFGEKELRRPNLLVTKNKEVALTESSLQAKEALSGHHFNLAEALEFGPTFVGVRNQGRVVISPIRSMLRTRPPVRHSDVVAAVILTAHLRGRALS